MPEEQKNQLVEGEIIYAARVTRMGEVLIGAARMVKVTPKQVRIAKVDDPTSTTTSNAFDYRTHLQRGRVEDPDDFQMTFAKAKARARVLAKGFIARLQDRIAKTRSGVESLKNRIDPAADE